MYVSNDMVEQYYAMHPETEDVLRGEHLKDGMVVLIESPGIREDLGRNLYIGQAYMARQRNRWCTVTRLKIDEEQGQIWFVGVYGDGSKMGRNYSINAGWLVKLDSIPAVEEIDEKLPIKPGDPIIVGTKTEAMNLADNLNSEIELYGTTAWSSLKILLGEATTYNDHQITWGRDARFQFIDLPDGKFQVTYPEPKNLKNN